MHNLKNMKLLKVGFKKLKNINNTLKKDNVKLIMWMVLVENYFKIIILFGQSTKFLNLGDLWGLPCSGAF